MTREPGGGTAFSILQFNMWGWVGFRGGDEIAHATASNIREHRPAVVTLNEVCLAQAETVRRDLAGWDLDYQLHHDLILRRRKGRAACDYGNAVMWLSSEPETRQPERYLSVPPGEQARKILAVKVDFLRLPTVLCVTHLSAGRSRELARARRHQIFEVSGYVSRWKKSGVEVILGGDFNEPPDSPSMDPMYLPDYGGGSWGLCHEASCARPADAPTAVRKGPFPPTHHGRKIDYVFMTDGYRPLESIVIPSKSDHAYLYASVS